MSVNLQQYQQLKSRVDALQKSVSRAEGALGQLTARLEKEFGCKTLKDAEKLADKLEKDRRAAEGCFDVQLAEFEQDWSASLGEEE